MESYAHGDAESFDALFARHRRGIFTYLLHQTGDRAIAEDLFQEVFLRLIRTRAGYGRTGSFRSWLYTIAHNALTDDRRRRGVRATDDTEEAEMEAGSVRGSAPVDPVVGAHRRDLRERVEAALQLLPAVQREVFVLRERAGMDFRSIAEATGCGLATAKSRMRYALENLRRALADEFVSVPEVGHE